MVSPSAITAQLQVPGSSPGLFEPSVLVQGVQGVQGSDAENFADTPKSREKRACDTCGRPLLPDEDGPECEGCQTGGVDPLEVRRMLTGEDANVEVQP